MRKHLSGEKHWIVPSVKEVSFPFIILTCAMPLPKAWISLMWLSTQVRYHYRYNNVNLSGRLCSILEQQRDNRKNCCWLLGGVEETEKHTNNDRKIHFLSYLKFYLFLLYFPLSHMIFGFCFSWVCIICRFSFNPLERDLSSVVFFSSVLFLCRNITNITTWNVRKKRYERNVNNASEAAFFEYISLEICDDIIFFLFPFY